MRDLLFIVILPPVETAQVYILFTTLKHQIHVNIFNYTYIITGLTKPSLQSRKEPTNIPSRQSTGGLLPIL